MNDCKNFLMNYSTLLTCKNKNFEKLQTKKQKTIIHSYSHKNHLQGQCLMQKIAQY